MTDILLRVTDSSATVDQPTVLPLCKDRTSTHWDPVWVLLPDSLRLGLSLLCDSKESG